MYLLPGFRPGFRPGFLILYPGSSDEIVTQVLEELGLSLQGELRSPPTNGANVVTASAGADAELEVSDVIVEGVSGVIVEGVSDVIVEGLVTS